MFVLCRQSATVRGLSQMFRTDLETVRKLMWGLEEQGMAERAEEGPPIIYRAAPDVSVEYRPSQIIVVRGDRAGSPAAPPAAANGHCTAVTSRGTPCKLRAIAGPYCSYHAPEPEL